MTQVRCYYHIYADGAWERIVDEFLRAWARSGVDTLPLNVGIVGSSANREAVKLHLQQMRPDAVVVAEAERGWEQVTLDQMHFDALHAVASDEEVYYLYAHTKCSAYPQGDLGENWRREMTWWNVVHADLAVAALDAGAHVAGIHWMQGLEGQPHYFGGNFWWARATVLAAIGFPGHASRYDAETWVGTAEHVVPEFKLHVLHYGFIGEDAPEPL